ncbi:MAG: NADH-quinone oxidoreductase subunit C [Bacteroidetes bacterium]|nr:NADH-quinone oxidoreductase subunit C [Bacteroidota bacterium]
MTNEELKTFISAHAPETVFEESQFLNAIIPAEKLYLLAKTLRAADYDYLICVSGVDWKDHFMVVYHLESRKTKNVFVLKAKITDRVNPAVDTVCDIWRTAELHEREVFDLFGIKFNNHPDLRRLFMDDTWGFPLRKDYVDDVTIVQL